MTTLTPEQLILLGLLVSALVQIIKWVVVWFKVERIDVRVITGITLVISLALAFLWIGPKLPTYNDPMDFIVQLVTIAVTLLGLAKIIYEWLLKALLEKLGDIVKVPLNTQQILDRKLPMQPSPG